MFGPMKGRQLVCLGKSRADKRTWIFQYPTWALALSARLFNNVERHVMEHCLPGFPAMHEAADMHNADTEQAMRVARVHAPAAPQIGEHYHTEHAPHVLGAPAPKAADISGGGVEPLISFEEAAQILGMGERNLRKIIQRSRDRIEGRWTNGPTIRFFQTHPKAAIKFRHQWLDDFIREHTHDPESAFLLPADEPRRRKKEHQQTGLGRQDGDADQSLGFDSSLYDV